MAKRFTDTEKFNDKWYRNLSLLHKAIWEFILAECNHAGILKFDIDLMSFKIGATVTLEDLESFGDRIIFLSEEVLFVPKFITFQYGKLNPQSKIHCSVLKELEKWGIDTLSIGYDKGMDTLTEPLPKGIDTLNKPLAKSMDTLKNKNKDKKKNKDKNISSLVLSSLTEVKNENVNPDFYVSDKKAQIFEIYEKECPDLIPITGEKRNRRILDKIHHFLEEIDGDFENYRLLCQKANTLKVIAKNKIDFEMMLNCHIGIMNGKYDNKASPNTKVSADFINSYFDNKREEEKIKYG